MHALGHLLGPRPEIGRHGAEPRRLPAQMLERRRPGQRLDAPDARARRALGGDREGADIAGLAHMRAAAELDRIGRAIGPLARAFERAHRHDADLVAVFLAEERLRADGTGVVWRHDARGHGAVLPDEGVHLRLDAGDLFGGKRRGVAEIEAQPVGRVERAALCHVIAERAAQRLVQKMRGRMIGADRAAAVVVHDEARGLPGGDLARLDLGKMHEDARDLAGIGHARAPARRLDHPGIAHLAARLGIKGRLVDGDLDLASLFRPRRCDPVPHQRNDLALGAFGIVAEKLGHAVLLGDVEPDRLIGHLARSGPGGARLGLLGRHGRIEPLGIDGAPLLAQRVLRQIERKAIGIVEPEGRLAGQGRALGQAGQFLVQKPQAALERLAKARLLEPQRLLDQGLRAAQFGIGLAHLRHQRGHQTVHDRIPGSQHVRMAHGAAHDPAQHIAAPLVGGHHPVGDEKGGGAQVIRDHPVMHPPGPVRILAGRMRARLDERAHEIGVVIVMLALQKRADPFEPHARVDRLHVERAHGAVLEPLVLHEDEVPDLDEAVAVFLRAARRAARDPGAVIVEDLGAGAAGPGGAHRPEIVIRGDADDPLVGQARVFLPDRRGLVIGVIDRDQEPVRVDPEIAREQIPGIGDCLFLEIIAEAEIAQHLEEGMVARGIADIVEIVVLAARAHAFLAGGGAHIVASFHPGEAVLELHHARIGEHQRRIVARHQRRAIDDAVIVALEEAQEGGADLVQRGHGRWLLAGNGCGWADLAARACRVHRRNGALSLPSPRPRHRPTC